MLRSPQLRERDLKLLLNLLEEHIQHSTTRSQPPPCSSDIIFNFAELIKQKSCFSSRLETLWNLIWEREHNILYAVHNGAGIQDEEEEKESKEDWKNKKII